MKKKRFSNGDIGPSRRSGPFANSWPQRPTNAIVCMPRYTSDSPNIETDQNESQLVLYARILLNSPFSCKEVNLFQLEGLTVLIIHFQLCGVTNIPIRTAAVARISNFPEGIINPKNDRKKKILETKFHFTLPI